MQEQIKLSGTDVYGKIRAITPFNDPLHTKPTNGSEPQAYWRMSFGTKVFTMSEAERTAWENGEINEISLTTTEYNRTVINPETNEPELNEDQTPKTVQVEGIAYSGHITHDQVEKVESAQAKLRGKVQGITAATAASVAKEYGISLQELQEAM